MKQEIVGKDFFTSLPFWGELGKTEQKTLERETAGLTESLSEGIKLRTRMCQHLARIQETLKAKGRFLQFLQSLNVEYRTQYRHLEAYREVQKALPEPVLDMAAERGMDLVGYTAARPFGDYTEIIKEIPPPKDAAHAAQWLEKLEAKRRETPRGNKRRRRDRSGEEALKRAFRNAVAAYNALPPGKTRLTWAKRLVNFLMLEFHLPAGSVQPEAVPEGVRAVVGRPRKETAA